MAVFIHYINDMLACTFSDSGYARDHAKRNAVIQIIVATAAFILMMRVFPAGLVLDHTLSEQKAYTSPEKAAHAGEPFTSRDKKLQTVYFTEEHLYQITLYMQCRLSGDASGADSVLFRLYDDGFSCIYEEEIVNKKIEKKGFLTATPDLDVGIGKAYYYEILVSGEGSAEYILPVAGREALAQQENSTLYIDGIMDDEVCLVADFDYARPLTVTGVIVYYVLIMAAASAVYLLISVLVWQYDERFSQDAGRTGRLIRTGTAAVSMLAAAALMVYSVVLNRFGGEVWDRLFFAAGIAAAESWLIGFLWRAPRVIRQKKRSRMPAGGIMGLTWRNYLQTVSFGLLFYALCRYVNADRDFYHFTNTRWMLIFLAAALLMNFNERQFVNIFSAVWLALGFAGSVLYCRTLRDDANGLLLARLTCGVVVSWGLLALNILLRLVRAGGVLPKGINVRGHGQQALYIALWAVFCILMYVNRYEKVWVFTATLPFLAFLFTLDTFPATCRFLRNFCNGVLLSFALVTAFSLMHRPHHYWMLYRYGGMFHTVACTGMYLAVVLGAALAKLYGKIRARRNMLLFGLPEYFVTACAASFVLLTMSRTAFLTTAVTVAAVMALTAAVYHKDVRRILSEFCVLAAVCLVSFPMVYTAVRMIPAVVNDPVRYEIEFQDRSFMIYEGDPVDSDKYMTVRRFFSTLFGRFQTSGQEGRGDGSIDVAEPAPQEAGTLVFAGNGLAGHIPPRAFSVLDVEVSPGEGEENDISNGRFEIFRDYIKAIGLGGHPGMGPEDKQGYEYTHAHNSYLQVAYNFGLIAGILFLVLCALTLWRSVRLTLDCGNQCSIVLVPFSVVVAFGVVSLTEWAYHPCIPAGFGYILMQMVLMRTDGQGRA